MGFNVKDYMLPPGTLIRFDGLGFNQRLSYTYHALGIKPGNIALVLNHKKPVYIDLLVEDRVILLSLEDLVDLVGWVAEFTPIYCGSGFREYPRWYPKYCYTYDI
jgi:hypothetical protein